MPYSYDARLHGHAGFTVPRMLAALIALGLGLPVWAQQAPPDQTTPDKSKATALEGVQVIGSRAKGRTAAETAAPVDVISHEQLENAGVTEVGQALQMLEPSFNFSRTFVSDGTDIIRPATLRGLGPDQVLVCQRQASSSAITGERAADRRARLGGYRHQCDTDRGDRAH